MSVITPGYAHQAGSHSAQSDRQVISALRRQRVETFTNSVGASGPAHGLVREGDLAVTQNGSPDMSVNVSAGRALISGSSSLAQGAYVFTNDATVNLAIATSDPTNPRWDIVVAQIRDNTEDSGGSEVDRLYVVTGTPAASPADPAIPAGCLALARVVVAASASSIVNGNITTVATTAGRIGGTWSRAAVQSIPNTTLTSISLDTEEFDSDGFCTPTSPTIAVPAGCGGLYAITAAVTYATATLASNYLQLAISGGTRFLPAAGNPTNIQSVTAVTRLSAGDSVVLQTFHSNGSAQNAAARIEMYLIGS